MTLAWPTAPQNMTLMDRILVFLGFLNPPLRPPSGWHDPRVLQPVEPQNLGSRVPGFTVRLERTTLTPPHATTVTRLADDGAPSLTPLDACTTYRDSGPEGEMIAISRTIRHGEHDGTSAIMTQERRLPLCLDTAWQVVVRHDGSNARYPLCEGAAAERSIFISTAVPDDDCFLSASNNLVILPAGSYIESVRLVEAYNEHRNTMGCVPPAQHEVRVEIRYLQPDGLEPERRESCGLWDEGKRPMRGSPVLRF